MSFVPSVEPERDGKRVARRGNAGSSHEPALDSPHHPPFVGPTALRPEAVLQRQTVLGNASVGRVFRAAAGAAAGPDQKPDCNCPDEEHCSCPK
jgi:hypothetical protein